MKTLINEIEIHSIEDLKNGAILKALIEEAEKKMSPCAHCGRKHPRIVYIFCPPELPSTIHKDHPHRLYGSCWTHKDDTVTGDCEMQGKVWYAEDNEADFKEALRLIIEAWNRRPGKPDP